MSKTKQRQVSSKSEGKEMRRQGFIDGLVGNCFKWKQHPKIKDYQDGFSAGRLRSEER